MGSLLPSNYLLFFQPGGPKYVVKNIHLQGNVIFQLIYTITDITKRIQNSVLRDRVPIVFRLRRKRALNLITKNFTNRSYMFRLLRRSNH